MAGPGETLGSPLLPLKVSMCRIFCVFGGMIHVEFNFLIQTCLYTIVYLYLQEVYNSY